MMGTKMKLSLFLVILFATASKGQDGDAKTPQQKLREANSEATILKKQASVFQRAVSSMRNEIIRDTNKISREILSEATKLARNLASHAQKVDKVGFNFEDMSLDAVNNIMEKRLIALEDISAARKEIVDAQNNATELIAQAAEIISEACLVYTEETGRACPLSARGRAADRRDDDEDKVRDEGKDKGGEDDEPGETARVGEVTQPRQRVPADRSIQQRQRPDAPETDGGSRLTPSDPEERVGDADDESNEDGSSKSANDDTKETEETEAEDSTETEETETEETSRAERFQPRPRVPGDRASDLSREREDDTGRVPPTEGETPRSPDGDSPPGDAVEDETPGRSRGRSPPQEELPRQPDDGPPGPPPPGQHVEPSAGLTDTAEASPTSGRGSSQGRGGGGRGR